jgi:hypothetical protein
MVELDEMEEMALREFLKILEEQKFEPKPQVINAHIQRRPNGHIIVPVALRARAPSLSLALLMGHKADQIYKQTACRLVLAQCPEKDPKPKMYVWTENAWSSIP